MKIGHLASAALLQTILAGICLAQSASMPGPTSQPSSRPDVVLDLGKGVKLRLVWVPAGQFVMGSREDEWSHRPDESPQHKVTISKPFFLAATEVTQEQYEAVTGDNPSRFRGVNKPVDSVSWNDAVGFCRKLADKTKRVFRLPTEAEWEYACRAGQNGAFSFPGDPRQLIQQYVVLAARTPAAAGSLKPNAFGVFDMLGSQWEWVADWYGPYDEKDATDPVGPTKGDRKVHRGGCFHNSPKFCRNAQRAPYPPDAADYDFSFRVLVEADPQPAPAKRERGDEPGRPPGG